MLARKIEINNEAGFSLVELVIAMAVMSIGMAMATSLLAGSFHTRSRENRRSEAIADAQRALNTISREVANSGFGLTSNGLVAGDSGANSLRIRANLNAIEGSGNQNATTDPNEDVSYTLSNGSLVRYDVNTGSASVLAERVDALQFTYFDATGAQTTVVQNAAKVTLSVNVQLPAVGAPRTTGYQPASQVQLTSDVALRNANLSRY